jgi:flagellar biosynthesis protein FlhB
MLKKLFFISLLTSSLVACKTAIQPMYVTTGEVASLTTGMTKQEAKKELKDREGNPEIKRSSPCCTR